MRCRRPPVSAARSVPPPARTWVGAAGQLTGCAPIGRPATICAGRGGGGAWGRGLGPAPRGGGGSVSVGSCVAN